MLAVQAREEVKPKLERRATVGSLFRRGLLRQEACRECGWQDAARCCGRAWHRASPTAPERSPVTVRRSGMFSDALKRLFLGCTSEPSEFSVCSSF